MDRRLQNLERAAAAGDPEASWQLALERYRSGEWKAGGADGEPYYESLQRAASLAGFAFLDARHYECGRQENDVARFTHEQTELEFCLIPGGSFLMGSSEEEPEREYDEGPTHTRSIGAFLIGATQCTEAVWERVTGEVPSESQGARRPVEEVSWEAATSFCDRAGLRLPSEAEWEYACRAGSTSTYCFGDREDELWHYAAYAGDEQGNMDTRDVSSKLPNAFGLYDMHGNVEEWCQDAYVDSYEGAPVDGTPCDRTGKPMRVYRGGTCGDEAWACRSARRGEGRPDDEIWGAGFRPARSLP